MDQGEKGGEGSQEEWREGNCTSDVLCQRKIYFQLEKEKGIAIQEGTVTGEACYRLTRHFVGI